MPNRETTLTLRALNRATLARQLLLSREKKTPLKAIECLTGMQAQEARPPFVGLWTRLRGFQPAKLARLLDQRKVVRTTMMRGTLHLMATKDYVALRPAIQPALSRGMKSILRKDLTSLDIPKMVAAAAKLLTKGPATFEEIREHLSKKWPAVNARAMGFTVRTHLPLVQVPTDASWSFARTTEFALAESWLGQSIAIDLDGTPDSDPAGTRALVLRYLAAFGPATPADAQAWSGLGSLSDVFDSLRPKLVTFRDENGRELFDLPKAPRPDAKTTAPVRFLPEFDNLVLAHADRTRLIADEHRPKVCTKNLRVLPTFFVDGMAAGLWKVARTKKTAKLTLDPFEPLPRAARSALTEEATALLEFLEPDAERHEIR